MAVGGHVVVGSAVEVGLERVDADEDAASFGSEDPGAGFVVASEPFLAGDERPAGQWPTVLFGDVVADADGLALGEAGFEEAPEL